MSKQVLIISTSMREGSNSDALAEAFAKGVRDGGNQVKTISLRDKHLDFCMGCLACQDIKRCVIADDAAEIVEAMMTAHVIVFATPIYFYEMSGQMKVLLDRSNPLFSSNYTFDHVYLLTTAADDEKRAMEGAQKGLEGWIACFDRARLAGTVFAGGVTGTEEIKEHEALKEAYRMARQV